MEFDEEWIERAIVTEAFVHNKIKIENQKIGIELLTKEELEIIREALRDKDKYLEDMIESLDEENEDDLDEINSLNYEINEIDKIFEKIM